MYFAGLFHQYFSISFPRLIIVVVFYVTSHIITENGNTILDNFMTNLCMHDMILQGKQLKNNNKNKSLQLIVKTLFGANYWVQMNVPFVLKYIFTSNLIFCNSSINPEWYWTFPNMEMYYLLRDCASVF